MHAPYIQRIIPPHFIFQVDSHVTYCTRCNPYNNRRRQRDKTRCRCNGSETCHCTREQANKLWFFCRPPLNDEPCNGSKRGSNICIQKCKSRNCIHIKLAAGIESIPSEPQQSGAD